MEINQYEVYWTDLDPARGSEIQKKRPCVVITPDEMNHNINTVIIAPMTSTSRNYPSRVKVVFGNRISWIVLDQLICVDKSRLMEKAGDLNLKDILKIKSAIKEILVD